jgi:hypothetical protein
MNTPSDFGKVIQNWAEGQSTVTGLVLIGSRQRSPEELLDGADAQSDWDFHIITSCPSMFADREWTRELADMRLQAYASRPAVIGGVPKVNAIFAEGDADFIVIPEGTLRKIKFRALLRLYQRDGWTRRRLQDIAEVIRPGWKFLKGEEQWGRLYRKAVSEVTDPHFDDAALRRLAEGFVCDYVWALRKIARGELRAVQRILHRELAETNFQLLHELKQRRGERTFTKARRIERIAGPMDLDRVTVDSRLEAFALQTALQKSAESFRYLMRALVGETWHWPDVK